MTKPIDREELEKWLNEQIEKILTMKEKQYRDGLKAAFMAVLHRIQSGAFDADNGESEKRPSIEHVAWVFEKIAEHISQGGGSFRKLIYDRMGFGREAYQRLYEAGGMVVTNAIEDAKETERLRAALKEMRSLFEAWDLRGICEERLEGYEQGVMLELIGLCEELVGINAPEKV